MLRNRDEAARLLARRSDGREWLDPLVSAIPRGGVATGAAPAREPGAELDVVLSRKLGCPYQPELAFGAVAEDVRVHFDPEAKDALELDEDDIARERASQLDEIARRKALFRADVTPVEAGQVVERLRAVAPVQAAPAWPEGQLRVAACGRST